MAENLENWEEAKVEKIDLSDENLDQSNNELLDAFDKAFDTEENEEENLEFDETNIEKNEFGIPVLTEDDIKKLKICGAYSGLGEEAFMMNIETVMNTIKTQYEAKEAKDKDPDDPLGELYDEKMYKHSLKLLAEYQSMARSKDIEFLTSPASSTLFEHTMAFQNFITNIYNKYIKDENIRKQYFDLDKTKSLADYFRNNNYYTIFFRNILFSLQQKENSKILETVLDYDKLNLVTDRFNYFFKTMFYYYAKRYYYNSGVFANRNQKTIISSLLDYIYNNIYLAISENSELADEYYNLRYSQGEITDEMKTDQLLKLREEISQTLFYLDLNTLENRSEYIDMAINFTKEVFKFVNDLSKADTDIKSTISKAIMLQIENIDKYIKSTLEVYESTKIKDFKEKVEEILKNKEKYNSIESIKIAIIPILEEYKGSYIDEMVVEVENVINTNMIDNLDQYIKSIKDALLKFNVTDVDIFCKTISEVSASYDLSDKEKEALTKNQKSDNENEEENSVEINIDASEESEIKKEMEELEKQVPQIERDKFTPKNYPVMEKVKMYENMKKIFVNYLVHNSDTKYVYTFVISLLSNSLTNEIYNTLKEFYTDNQGSKLFINSVLSPETEFEKYDIDTIEKSYSGNNLAPKYQEMVVASNLSDLNIAIHLSEFADNNMSMYNDLLSFYNTRQDAPEDQKINCIKYMYEKNNLSDIRMDIYKLSNQILNKSLEGVKEIFNTQLINNFLTKKAEEIRKTQELQRLRKDKRLSKRQRKLKNKKK